MFVNGERASDEHAPGKSSRTPGRGRPERERREVINVQGVGRRKWGERGIYTIERQLLAVS